MEDEVHLADAVQRGPTAEGFQVDVVHDGTRGLQLAGGNTPSTWVPTTTSPNRSPTSCWWLRALVRRGAPERPTVRTKIDAPFAPRTISTVRGVGYRLLGNGG